MAPLNLITSSISMCISTGKSQMDEQVTEAARNYYLSIVDAADVSIEEKRQQIYDDLVIGTKANLFALNGGGANDNKLHYVDEDKQKRALSVTYRVGLSNDEIHRVSGDILCVGQYKDSDIHVPSTHVSRIHAFIFRIDDKMIVLDGWSKCGTRTIAVARNNNNEKGKEKKKEGKEEEEEEEEDGEDEDEKEHLLISSMPDKRNILQFNVSDSIHLRVGDASWASDLVLNPKPCVACTENARSVRLACGHQTLCNACYATLQQQTMSVAKCPLCRAPIIQDKLPLNVSAGLKTFADAASKSDAYDSEL